MGMYTEFIFGCRLSKDTPRICIEALDKSLNDIWDEESQTYIKKPKYENPKNFIEQEFNNDYIERTLPEEEIDAFIRKYDFNRLFHSSSYYFGAANPISKFYYNHINKNYHISTRADLKNYNSQIENFIEYITPYVEHGSGYEHKLFAYVQYEESEFPTLYGIDGKYDVVDPEITKAYMKKNKARWDLLCRLYTDLVPEYEITQEELDKAGIKSEELTVEQSWELMINYIINKYKND